MSDKDAASPMAYSSESMICRNGNSLTVSVTKGAKALGLTAGDYVKVTIEKAHTGLIELPSESPIKKQ